MTTKALAQRAKLFSSVQFRSGVVWKNAFMLAPLTNQQSYPDGTLSNDEFEWLTYRAKGGFGLVMTCAAHVQEIGQGFEGQLGIYSDEHMAGLAKLAGGIQHHGAVSSIQLHHGGVRSPLELIGAQPVGPSNNIASGARGLTFDEVVNLREDFIRAAVRAERAGFNGVELHGAHGYILSDFLSPEFNRRNDQYGGPLENRTRLIWEIIDGIKAHTKKTFQLGLRISPESNPSRQPFGMQITDQLEFARQLFASEKIDYLDLSCWDSFKEPEDQAFAGKSLTQWFAELPRGGTKLGVAGKIYSADDCARALEHGADFAIIGRAAVLHHDFPTQVALDSDFRAVTLPVSAGYLAEQRLGPKFIDYMRRWKNFVED